MLYIVCICMYNICNITSYKYNIINNRHKKKLNIFEMIFEVCIWNKIFLLFRLISKKCNFLRSL